MPEYEDANAHDSGDCGLSCTHPDHQYLGDDFTDEELTVLLRRMANDSYIPWEDAMRTLGIDETNLGPVVL